MRLKLKHLRSVLNKANIATSTCRDKRDLAELIVKNKEKFRAYSREQPQTQQQQQQQQSQNSSTFNNTFNSFINNVQDFVNFNLSSVLNPNTSVPCGPPPPRPNIPNTASTSTSSTSTSNLGSVFNLNIPSEQFADVLNNNLFTFNNDNINRDQAQAQAQAQATTSEQTETEQPTSTNTNTNNTETGSNVRRRASLSNLKCEQDIESLSIKQIKEILACNFVEYKGCCERKELLDKLKRLYQSFQENKRIEMEINDSSRSVQESSASKSSSSEGDLCKICMESLIECVLLDCGHMCSCIKCGKQLAECPICRQNVVRVVRVFKS